MCLRMRTGLLYKLTMCTPPTSPHNHLLLSTSYQTLKSRGCIWHQLKSTTVLNQVYSELLLPTCGQLNTGSNALHNLHLCHTRHVSPCFGGSGCKWMSSLRCWTVAATAQMCQGHFAALVEHSKLPERTATDKSSAISAQPGLPRT